MTSHRSNHGRTLASLVIAGLVLSAPEHARGDANPGTRLEAGALSSPVSDGRPGSRRPRSVLHEDFSAPAWREAWSEERLSRGRNVYDVVADSADRVLRVTSSDAAGGLWRDIRVKPLHAARASWRWKVDRSLSENGRERERGGDDYAARFKVVFEDRFPIWNTRVISYVWAGREPVGSRYRNPYSRNVATIVLRSGDDEAGAWVEEERDLVADYRAFFGHPPRELSAVAVMVDTDNTNAEAAAGFDDIHVEAE